MHVHRDKCIEKATGSGITESKNEILVIQELQRNVELPIYPSSGGHLLAVQCSPDLLFCSIIYTGSNPPSITCNHLLNHKPFASAHPYSKRRSSLLTGSASVITPSARHSLSDTYAMATDSATPSAAAPAVTTKVSRPDEEAYQKTLAKLQKEHDEALARYVSGRRAFSSPFHSQR